MTQGFPPSLRHLKRMQCISVGHLQKTFSEDEHHDGSATTGKNFLLKQAATPDHKGVLLTKELHPAQVNHPLDLIWIGCKAIPPPPKHRSAARNKERPSSLGYTAGQPHVMSLHRVVKGSLCLFPKRLSGHLSSMPCGVIGTVAIWANRPVGFLSCPVPPHPAALQCRTAPDCPSYVRFLGSTSCISADRQKYFPDMFRMKKVLHRQIAVGIQVSLQEKKGPANFAAHQHLAVVLGRFTCDFVCLSFQSVV